MTSSSSVHATREQSRVALVTYRGLPDLWEDDHPLRAALRTRGVTVDAVSWDDPTADWAAYDLAVLRSPWDYTERLEEFLAWARSVPRLANPAPVVAWNTDKRYLGELAAAGLPVTPTDFVGPGSTWTPPATGEWVIKPAVSVGSRDTGRYRLPDQRAEAMALVTRLTAGGRTVLIQPYLPAVETHGETAVLFLPDTRGELTPSHAIRKGPILTGPHATDPDPSATVIDPREATPAEIEAAHRVLKAVPGGADALLYARVDLIPGPDGEPLLSELELAEPQLFLRTSPPAADRLADAIVARL